MFSQKPRIHVYQDNRLIPCNRYNSHVSKLLLDKVDRIVCYYVETLETRLGRFFDQLLADSRLADSWRTHYREVETCRDRRENHPFQKIERELFACEGVVHVFFLLGFSQSRFSTLESRLTRETRSVQRYAERMTIIEASVGDVSTSVNRMKEIA